MMASCQRTKYVKVNITGTGRVLNLAEDQFFPLVDGFEVHVALASSGASAKHRIEL